MTFNNLKLDGTKYSYTFKHTFAWNSTSTTASYIDIEYGSGTNITSSNNGGQHNAGNNISFTGVNLKCFIPNESTIQVNVANAGATNLLGNGTIDRTHATLCELPASTICDSNKWD